MSIFGVHCYNLNSESLTSPAPKSEGNKISKSVILCIIFQYVKIDLLVKGRSFTVLKTGCLGEYLHLGGKVVDVSRNIIKVVESRKFKFKFKCVGENTDVCSENVWKKSLEFLSGWRYIEWERH
jgi:hypothetical protein